MTPNHKFMLSRPQANAGLPTAVLAELQTAFSAFRERHKADLQDIRAEVREGIDANACALAALQMNGVVQSQPASVGNRGHETEALAQFSRFGEVRADLSIGGAGGGDLSKGGAAVFPAISNQIRVRQFAQSALARLARRVTIEAGSAFEEPQDIGDAGAGWVDEGEARPALATPDFARLSVPVDEVYTLQKITQRLLDDSNYPLGEWMAGRIADKLARMAGAAFMTGNGTKKPKGLADYPTTAEADTVRAWGTVQALYTGVSGAFAAVDPADILIDAVYALAARYRPMARWIMNSRTAGVVRKMKDADGRFLWSDPISAGQPPLLLGFPVELDEYAPDMAADAKAIFFGSFSDAYIVVEKPGLRLLRDPYSDKPNVNFYAYQRIGGRLQDSEAVKAITFGVEPV